MKEMWDKRYSSEEYVYGEEPNQFVKDVLNDLALDGTILFPAEGEGRNAVYAAKMGLSVLAFDISIQAKLKALKLAENNNVNIQYEVGTLSELNLKPSSFDAAVFVSAHMPQTMRANFHQEIAKLIKPGGYIILEGFSKSNFEIRIKNPSVGGPDKEAMLFSEEEIKSDFPAFEIIKLEEAEVELQEGSLHNGLAKVIRFIGKRK